MGQVIQRQHPAVVLKSHYKAVRALLAAALIAIVALAATVVILANDDDNAKVSAAPKAAVQQDPGTRRRVQGPRRWPADDPDGPGRPVGPSDPSRRLRSQRPYPSSGR